MASAGEVASIDDRWFAALCEQHPVIVDRSSNRCDGDEVVVSNAWGLGVVPDTWHVSLRSKPIRFPAGSATSPIARLLGRMTYVLSFDTRAGAMRLGERLANQFGFPLLDWTEIAPAPADDTGRAA